MTKTPALIALGLLALQGPAIAQGGCLPPADPPGLAAGYAHASPERIKLLGVDSTMVEDSLVLEDQQVALEGSVTEIEAQLELPFDPLGIGDDDSPGWFRAAVVRRSIQGFEAPAADGFWGVRMAYGVSTVLPLAFEVPVLEKWWTCLSVGANWLAGDGEVTAERSLYLPLGTGLFLELRAGALTITPYFAPSFGYYQARTVREVTAEEGEESSGMAAPDRQGTDVRLNVGSSFAVGKLELRIGYVLSRADLSASTVSFGSRISF